MQVTTTVEETRKLVKNWKKEGKTIYGFSRVLCFEAVIE